MIDTSRVYESLSGWRPVRLKFGKVKYFAGDKYDTVYVEVVDSPRVYDLHNNLRDLPHVHSQHRFTPHVTIAKVKPGLGAAYSSQLGSLEGSDCVCGTAVFSDEDGTKHVFPLGRTVTVEKDAMSYLDAGIGAELVAPPARGKLRRLKRNKQSLRRVLKDALDEVGAVGINSSSLTSADAADPLAAFLKADEPPAPPKTPSSPNAPSAPGAAPRPPGDSESSASESGVHDMLRAIHPAAWRANPNPHTVDIHPRLVAADYLQDLGRNDEAENLRDTSKHLFVSRDNRTNTLHVRDAGPVATNYATRFPNGVPPGEYRSVAYTHNLGEALHHGHMAGIMRRENMTYTPLSPGTLTALLTDAETFRSLHLNDNESSAMRSPGSNFAAARVGDSSGFKNEHADRAPELTHIAEQFGPYGLYADHATGVAHGTYEVPPNAPAPQEKASGARVEKAVPGAPRRTPRRAAKVPGVVPPPVPTQPAAQQTPNPETAPEPDSGYHWGASGMLRREGNDGPLPHKYMHVPHPSGGVDTAMYVIMRRPRDHVWASIGKPVHHATLEESQKYAGNAPLQPHPNGAHGAVPLNPRELWSYGLPGGEAPQAPDGPDWRPSESIPEDYHAKSVADILRDPLNLIEKAAPATGSHSSPNVASTPKTVNEFAASMPEPDDKLAEWEKPQPTKALPRDAIRPFLRRIKNGHDKLRDDNADNFALGSDRFRAPSHEEVSRATGHSIAALHDFLQDAGDPRHELIAATHDPVGTSGTRQNLLTPDGFHAAEVQDKENRNYYQVVPAYINAGRDPVTGKDVYHPRVRVHWNPFGNTSSYHGFDGVFHPADARRILGGLPEEVSRPLLDHIDKHLSPAAPETDPLPRVRPKAAHMPASVGEKSYAPLMRYSGSPAVTKGEPDHPSGEPPFLRTPSPEPAPAPPPMPAQQPEPSSPNVPQAAAPAPSSVAPTLLPPPPAGVPPHDWQHAPTSRTPFRFENKHEGGVRYVKRQPAGRSDAERVAFERERQQRLAQPARITPPEHDRAWNEQKGVYEPGEVKKMTERVQHELGFAPHELVDIADGIPGAHVKPWYGGVNPNADTPVHLNVEHPDATSWSRVVKVKPDGTATLHNSSFFLRPSAQGGGIGTRAFSNQVAGAIKSGIGKIKTYAGRSGGNTPMNGYKTWPSLGYDAPLEPSQMKRLPPPLKGAKTVQDLYSTPEGHEWWAKHGASMSMEFDVSPGSRSMQVLNAYLARKGLPPIDYTHQQSEANQKRQQHRASLIKRQSQIASLVAANPELRDTKLGPLGRANQLALQRQNELREVHNEWTHRAILAGHDPAILRNATERDFNRTVPHPGVSHADVLDQEYNYQFRRAGTTRGLAALNTPEGEAAAAREAGSLGVSPDELLSAARHVVRTDSAVHNMSDPGAIRAHALIEAANGIRERQRGSMGTQVKAVPPGGTPRPKKSSVPRVADVIANPTLGEKKPDAAVDTAVPRGILPEENREVPDMPESQQTSYRPGEITSDGGKYEPPHEPELGNFIANQFKGSYGEPDHGISYSTGYLLSDGRGVPMGPGERYDDHRQAIPSSAAMKRWGWPEDIVRQNEEGTRTPAMFELMRRAQAVRVHAGRGTLVLHFAHKPTASQLRAITEHVREYGPGSVVVSHNRLEGEQELSNPRPHEVVRAIEQVTSDRKPQDVLDKSRRDAVLNNQKLYRMWEKWGGDTEEGDPLTDGFIENHRQQIDDIAGD